MSNVCPSRCAIPAIELRDDEEQTPFFHRSVVAPLSPKQLRPPVLEVRKMIRVMQKLHRIGFGVSHPNLNLVLSHSTVSISQVILRGWSFSNGNGRPAGRLHLKL